MAITLAEARVGMADHVDQMIVDTFRRSSLLLDMLTFDDAISPGTGGSTLTYGYVQLTTPGTAAVRALNQEYQANEAKRVKKTATAIVMGGSFEVDRVIQNTSGAVDEINFQLQQKIAATSNYFHNLVINGSSLSSGSGYVVDTFDGLRRLIAGKGNELHTTVDISTAANMDSNKHALLDELDALVAAVDGGADILMMNGAMLGKVRSIARRAGYYEQKRDEFGRVVETFNGIPLLDMGKYYNGSSSVDVVATESDDTTAIYAAKLGLDAFHGISPMGGKVINTYLPDLTAPGAVKKGEVELVAGVVLKNTLKAASLDGIKIA